VEEARMSRRSKLAIIRKHALAAWRTARGNDDVLDQTINVVASLSRQEIRAASPVAGVLWTIYIILSIIGLLYQIWSVREPEESDENDLDWIESMGFAGI
jgi:hypothetical protein